MFCTSCGASVNETQEFCTSCGLPLRSGNQTERHSSDVRDDVLAVASEHESLFVDESSSRRFTTPVLVSVAGGLSVFGLIAGTLLTAVGATSFAIGPRFNQEELDSKVAESRQIGYDNGKDIGYNDGYTSGKGDGYAAGKTDGYDSGYQEGISGGYNSGFDDGQSEGYSLGKSDGYSEGKTEGYSAGQTDGYSEGNSDGYDQGYTYGCKAIFRLMMRTSFTWNNRTYYESSFCS